jgi:hypothetical protein
MTFTLTWQSILLPILVIAAIVAVIYLCMVLAKVLDTLKRLDPVLADVKDITEAASDLTQKADRTVNGMSDSVSAVVTNLKANKSMIKNASAVVGAATSIVGVAKSAGKKKAAKVAAKAETGKKAKKTK